MTPVAARAAAIAERVLRSEPPRWRRSGLAEALPAPPDEPARAHRCLACRRAGLAPWTCTGCGRSLCEHRMKVQRVNGTGLCRRCAWARVRAFNVHFGLAAPEPEPGPAPD